MLFSTICRRPVFKGSAGMSKQLLKVMKLIIFFLMVVCLHVSASGYGQKGTVTISGKDLSLEKVFSVIKKQTDYVCFYGYDILKDAKPVSLSFKDADVQEVLKAALWGQGLDFSITGKTITIMKKPVTAAASSAGPGRTVKAVGVVYNEVGQPLSGANVTIKATGKGTITNAKGEFELPAVPVNSSLIISFIGYAPQEINPTEGTTLQLYLKIAKNELDKVVVQAYGTTTQRLATGDIATVTKEQIERQPVMNVLSALEGQVPGLVITANNQYASAPFNVEIRGRSVINATLPSEPLYIIDGVPLTVLSLGGLDGNGQASGFLQNGFMGPAYGQSPLFSINPSDIESVTVLKDADATAIYGSRGANGVIIINTKKGKIGKTKLEVNAYTGESHLFGRHHLLNTQQYLEMRREALKNDNITTLAAGDAYDLLIWDTTRYTDFQKELWGGTGRTVDVQTSLSGGDKQSTFRIGGGYHRQTGIFTRNGADQRGSVQFNLSHRSLDEKLQLSLSSQYSITHSDLLDAPNAVLLPPNAPSAFNSAGYLNFSEWSPVQDQVLLWNSLLKPYTAQTTFLNSQFSLTYQILTGLTFTAQLGYSSFHNSQMMITPIIAKDPTTNPRGTSQFGNNNGYNAIMEPQLEYKSVIGKFNFSVMGGASLQDVSQDGNTIIGDGYVNDNLLHSIANAPIKNASDVSGKYHYNAVFGRLNVNFENRYIVNLSVRRDGSSRFGPGRQFGNFGSIGAAWIFSDYSWWKDHLPFFSFGKLRGSYGTTGSDLIGDYGYLSLWSAAGTYPYQGIPSYLPLGFANPDLQWQVNRKLEGAINFGLLKDRISLEFAYYRDRCSNQLLPEILPSLTGFSNILANQNATIQNSGIESRIRAKIFDKKDFEWTFSFNIGKNSNKLIAYPNLSQSAYSSAFVVGQSVNIRKFLHFTGVDPQTGLYTYLDKNHDGRIVYNAGDTTNDLFAKDMSVKFNGGFGSDIRYKNFQINIFFIFRKQLQINGLYNQVPGTIGTQPNQSTDVLNRWQKPGDNAKYARFTTMPDRTDYLITSSDAVVANGSFVRLQNVSISYEIPFKAFKNTGFNAAKVYLSGQNLFVISKFPGIDPESPGVGGMPTSKTFTAGLQFTF